MKLGRSLLALVVLGCHVGRAPDFDTDDTDGEGGPRFRVDCTNSDTYFLDAVVVKYSGSENYFLYPSAINLIASTDDGSLLVKQGKRSRILGTMAIQSRPCGGPGQPPECNIVGFNGKLLGYDVAPQDAALALHDDFWCADEETPFWFTGLATMEGVDRSLFIYLEEAGIPEADGDPVMNPNAVVYGMDVQVWEVPSDCALADVPCGEKEPLATGRMLRSDRLHWD